MLGNVLVNALDLREGTGRIKVSSLAFADHAPIPPRFTVDGEGISPPLDWRDVPTAATSLALIVEDADSGSPTPLVHAIAVGIDRKQANLPEGALDAWRPPAPPEGSGPHRYVFQVFALVDDARASSGVTGRDELLERLRESAVASGWMIGIYSRDNSIAIKKDEPVVAEPMLAPAADVPLPA